MTNQNNDRYGGNRNLWRRTYGYSNVKPVIAEIVDQRSEVTYSLDINHVTRHRDFFKIDAVVSGTFVFSGFGEYDEGLVFFDFDGITEKTFNYNFSFSKLPYVTLNVDHDTSFSNVNPYGITYSTTGAYIGISAPYSGNIRYRAIYSPVYPAYVTSSFTTSFMTASAGQVVLSNDNYYFSLFGALPSVPDPNYVYQTAWDSSSGTSNIFIDDIVVGTNYISSSLSSLYSNKVHFIVLTSGSSGSFGSGFSYTFGFYFGA